MVLQWQYRTCWDQLHPLCCVIVFTTLHSKRGGSSHLHLSLHLPDISSHCGDMTSSLLSFPSPPPLLSPPCPAYRTKPGCLATQHRTSPLCSLHLLPLLSCSLPLPSLTLLSFSEWYKVVLCQGVHQNVAQCWHTGLSLHACVCVLPQMVYNGQKKPRGAGSPGCWRVFMGGWGLCNVGSFPCL